MSEVPQEQTSPEQPQEQGTSQPSFPLAFVARESGRSHGVDGGGRMDVIRDEQGNPEVEYALVAEIDGVQVPLQTFSYSQLNQLAAIAKASQQQQQQQV